MKKTDVVKFFGNARAVARAIGMAEVTIYKWGDDVPRHLRARVLAAANAKLAEMMGVVEVWSE